jgi:HAE1 family hydrophobic/amphiphilic exporter-1
MTLSLAAVFIPVLFMGGMLGRLLHEFAVTIAVAVLVSGFVSLTLTPMLCSRFVKPPKETHHGRVYVVTQRFFDGMLGLYDHTLQFVLRHRLWTIFVFLATLVATLVLFVVVPKGFFPSEDTGQIFGSTEAGQDISFEGMRDHQLALMKIVNADTNVAGYMSSIGAGGPTAAGNSGRLFMRLAPRSKRPHVDEVIQELRRKLAAVPGISVYLQNPPIIRIGGTLSKGLYQLTLQGSDPKELYHWAPIIQERIAALRDKFQDVTTDLLLNNPQVKVDIDRDKARTLGVTADQIEDALYNAYGSRQVSTIYAPVNEYWVIMELMPEFQRDPSAIGDLYVRCAVARSSECQPRCRSADDQSFRAIAGRDRLV